MAGSPADTAMGRVYDRQDALAADLAAHREADALVHGEIVAKLHAVDAKLGALHAAVVNGSPHAGPIGPRLSAAETTLAALARSAERRSDRQWQLWAAAIAAVLSGIVGAVAALHR